MDGKLFLYSNATPPPISQVAATTFVFDLQRFTVTDSKWSAADVAGYDTQGDHAIKVVNGSTTKYFDYMQSAMNFVLGNQVSENTYNNYAADGATVTLLKDITNGDAFTIGTTRSATTAATKATIDLDGHKYLFANVLDSTNASTTLISSVSKDKAIATEKPSSGTTSIIIKNGTIGIAENAIGQFNRLMKCYIDLTLENVTIDGTNFPVGSNGLAKEFDGAIIAHSLGNLKLIGSTSIIAPEGYYAVGGKLAADDANYGAGFNIAVNTTGTISNISMYEWGEPTRWSLSSGTFVGKGTLSIGGGTIGEVRYSEKAINTGAMSTTTINGGAVVNSITYGNTSTTSLAYAESADSVNYDTRSATMSGSTGGNGKIFIFGQTGWNPDSTTEKKFNFVAESVASGDATSLKAGQIIIAAEGATTTSAFAYDSDNKVIGLPTDITATWGPGLEDTTLKEQYAVAKMDYNGSAKDAVTISEVSLGADTFKPVFIAKNNSDEEGGLFAETVKKIDASALSVAASIVGNSLDNTIYGGAGADSLTGGTATSLRGSNTFYYSAGQDVITDFNRNTDKIVVTTEDFAPAAGQIQSLSANQFGISLSADNQLKLNGVANLGTTNVLPTNGVKVAAERNGKEVANYVYTAYSVADMTGDKANGVTLGSNAGDSFSASNPFVTINAAEISTKFDITGFTNANYIVAGQGGGSLNGNGGDDTLRGGSGNDVFIYSAGKNVIEEYRSNDVVDMTATNITSAKSNRKGLVFSTKSSSNILTFKPVGDAEDAVEKVSLNAGGFLTKDGAVGSDKKFSLFAGTKGAIDLVNDTIYSGASITAIDASNVTNSVTLTATDSVTSLELGANKRRDLFEYGGGNITISGYENGSDKLNIESAGAISAFSVDATSKDVAISVGSATNVISLKAAQDQEVLIHDENSKGNSFDKFVFHDTGVLYNKEKPTEAMIYSNAAGFSDSQSSLKKIFALENVKGISIASSDNKMTLDASAANGVSLVGGAKNNKFIGSGGKDMFIYNGGKDVIEDFGIASGTTDSISFGAGKAFSVQSAKITLNKKSVKFKFDSKNTLTLKNDDSIGSTFQIGDTNYSYAKNSIVDGKQVSLTSQFSGSYKIEDGVNNVDGHLVQKNLTFKGTAAQETLIGGNNSNRKTTFKGSGGADSLVGGDGKDIFFYAKGDSGTSTIAKFDFDKDRIKIANGTISKIESLNGGGVQFAMTSGKKGDTSPIGWFNVTTNKDNNAITDKIAIKANSTCYWFADETDVASAAAEEITIAKGDLITSDRKITKSQLPDGYAILDLGYSTNLAKSAVAIKVTGATPTRNQS